MKSNYYKHPKYGHVYGEPLATPRGRLCWPALVNPKAPPPPQPGQQPGQPRFEITLALDDDETTELFGDQLAAMATDMLKLFNEGRRAKVSDLNIFQDGNDFDTEKYPYYRDKLLLVARNVDMPLLVGNERGPDGHLLNISPDKLLGGMLVKALVTPLITAHGLSYKLNKLRFIADDGTRYAGGFNAARYDSLLEDAEDEDVAVKQPPSESEVNATNELEGEEETQQPEKESVATQPAAKRRGRKKITDIV